MSADHWAPLLLLSGFFSAIGLDFPALAVGGVVGQLVKKPRLPVDAAMAASLAHAVPGVNRLKLGPLLTPFLDQRHPYPAQPHDDGGISARLVTLIRSAEGPIDAYGGPFMFCTWFNGLATVGTATACAHYGLDVIGFVETLLSSFGPILGCDDAAASAQTMVTVSATSAAAAKCTNSLTLPLRLALLGSFGRPLFAAIDRVREESLRQERATLKTMFRKRPDHPGRLKRRNVVAS
mmetsp:Transcript_2504/g.3738  ORF Transcript_2504/g.3738 Transcript_2504/m.3738 type:complete len:236 (+) Transcript_2504:226-933(+)